MYDVQETKRMSESMDIKAAAAAVRRFQETILL